MASGKGGFEEIRKDLKIIKETQRRILSSLDQETIEKAAKYDKLVLALSSLEFEVSSIAHTHDERGNVLLLVNYGRPTGTIVVNQSGEVNWDAFSSAMSDLRLIGYEDMAKIADAIESSLT